MTESVFKEQIRRLSLRFGEASLDNEFILLVWRETCTMSDIAFMRLTDILIGTRPRNKPPLLTDFREARLKEESNAFRNEVYFAAASLEHPSTSGGLQKFLDKEYKGCKSVMEAVQVQILRNKIKEAEEK